MCWRPATWNLLPRVLLWAAAAAAAAANAGAVGGGDRRVIVVVSSPGSGAELVSAVLGAAGVWVHPAAAATYQEHVAQRPEFGAPGGSSGLLWETRSSPGNFDPSSLTPRVRQQLQQAHEQVAHAVLRGAPAEAAVIGWEAGAAIHALPCVVQALANLNISASIIHHLRDGRSAALAALHPAAAGAPSRLSTPGGAEQPSGASHTQPARAEAAAGAWAAVNLGAKAWATGNALGLRRRYSITRLEDLCDAAVRRRAVEALLANAGLLADAGKATAAVDAQQHLHCEPSPGAAWQAAWASRDASLAAVARRIDSSAAAALDAFDYQPATALELPPWLAARAAMAQLRAAARRAAAAPPPHGASASAPGRGYVIVTFVSNGYERILDNWLAWLVASRVSLGRVLVIARGSSHAAVSRLLHGRGPRVLSLPPLAPSAPAGTNEQLGAQADPRRHLRAGVWLERVRVLHELVAAGHSVILSDLDAIWLADAGADLAVRGARGPGPPGEGLWQGAPHRPGFRGYDLIMSPGYFPFDVYAQLGVTGCMGFVFANATAPAAALLRGMLREKLAQLALREVKFYNDQRVLNEQLIQAGIATNATLPPPQPPSGRRGSAAAPPPQQAAASSPHPVHGAKATTAPGALAVLFLPDTQYQRVCAANASYAGAVVVHCQSPKSGTGKVGYLQGVRLWRAAAAADGQQAVVRRD